MQQQEQEQQRRRLEEQEDEVSTFPSLESFHLYFRDPLHTGLSLVLPISEGASKQCMFDEGGCTGDEKWRL